ncbi:MAG: hypothetical protein WC444_06435 [Candidatus Paceibacterota bacterium]
MTEQAGTMYKIRGDDPYDWVLEANRIFELISTRMDNLEGYRGHGKFYNYVEHGSDVVITDNTKGVVLRDNGNPASYWRVTINSAGTVVLTNIGRVYP